MAWRLGFKKVICGCDCTKALRLGHVQSSKFHVYGTIIHDISLLLDRDWDCTLQHIYREGNQAVDFLAKYGTTLSMDFTVWDKPLVGIDHILLADFAGTIHLRQVFCWFFSFSPLAYVPKKKKKKKKKNQVGLLWI